MPVCTCIMQFKQGEMAISGTNKEITTPYISANKLSEFRLATPARKRTIIKSLKYPTTYMNGRYVEAKSAIIAFMNDELHKKEILQQKRNQVLAKPTITAWQKDNKKGCLEAIDHLFACSETILVEYLSYRGGKAINKEDYNTMVNGVNIHLQPEIILLDSKTKGIKGFIKLVFSKSRNIDWQEGYFTAALIKSQMEKRFGVKLKEKDCIVLDVFNRRKHEAPKFLQSSKTHLRLTCNEIASLWSTITNQ